ALLSMRADRFWKKTGKKITIQGTDVAGFDKLKVVCFNCHKMGHFARECRAPRSQDKGRRESYKQGSKEEEPAPKALMAIDGIGWDWSYMANKEENHALVADNEAPTEFALMAKSSSSSKNELYDDSFCSKSCRKNTDSLNTKISKLNEELSDSENTLYHYKLVLFPLPAQVYSPLKKDMSWIGLPGFTNDTITDYSRPSPSIESNTSDLQNSNSSVSEHRESSSSIISKPMIKFVKAADSPTIIKTNKVKTARKSSVKYAEVYRNTSKSPKVRGNQRNWNNLRSQQLGKGFLMKNKACFKCGHFDHLAYDCGVWVEKGKTWPKNNFAHKNVTPRAVLLKTDRTLIAVNRTNMNVAQPKRTSFAKTTHSYVRRPFQGKSVVKTQFQVLRVPLEKLLRPQLVGFGDLNKTLLTKFWYTARIETTNEGTKILATVDGKPRTISESSIRRNLKLNDQEGISSLPDTKLFENLALMGYNILPNQRFTFKKGQFSHQWKFLIHTIMQCLSPKITGFNEFSSNIATAVGEGSAILIEPHHTPSPQEQQSPHYAPSSPSNPTASTEPIPTETPTETPTLRQYSRRATRIAQSKALFPATDEPASLLRDDIQGEAFPTVYVEALQVKHPIIDWEIHSEGKKDYWKIIRLGGHTAVYQFFVDMLKQIDREDLNQLWALVKETLSIRQASRDKEKELWVDLKRLFEPDFEDQEMQKVLLRGWEKFFEIQHAQLEDTHEFLHRLLEDLQIIIEELAEYINSLCWNRPTFYDDDHEYSIQYKEYLENSSNAIVPVLPTKEPKYSLSMGDEHLSTIPKTKSDKLIKSSVENLVPIPSESEVTSDNESESDVPVNDESSPNFKTFSNTLFNCNANFTSSDDESLSNEDFDFLLNEFSGELAHIDLIPPGIEEADFDLEEEIHLVENLLYDNSYPRPSKELNAEIANTIVESLSPSHIPVEDSDSQMQEIDLFLDMDDLMPPDIESDDYELEGDIHILEELLSNDTLPLPENESSKFDHHDDPSFSRPPPKPPDVEIFFDFKPDTGVLTTKVVKGIYEHYVLMSNILPTLPTFDPLYPVYDTLLSFSSKNKDKVFKPGILSYLLVSNRDKTTFDFSKNPMMMYGGDIPLLVVLYLHFYPP
nr:ribonuclease H-like domain-containing protein [Tanacetum cinerariifolium]